MIEPVNQLSEIMEGDGPPGAVQKGSPAKEATALAKADEELKYPKLSYSFLAAAGKAPKNCDAVRDMAAVSTTDTLEDFDFDRLQNDDDASVADDSSTYEDGFCSDATITLDDDEAEDEDTDDAATVSRVAAEAPAACVNAWVEPSPRSVHAAAAVPALPLKSEACGPEALSQPVYLPAGDAGEWSETGPRGTSELQRHAAECNSIVDRQRMPLMPYESEGLMPYESEGILKGKEEEEIAQSERLSFKGMEERPGVCLRPRRIKGRIVSRVERIKKEIPEDDEDPWQGAERVGLDYSKQDRQRTWKGRSGRGRTFVVLAAHSGLEADCPRDIVPPPSEQRPGASKNRNGICKPKLPPQGSRFRRAVSSPGPAVDVLKEMGLVTEAESKAAAGAGFRAVRCYSK
jgi:hypothetical protein